MPKKEVPSVESVISYLNNLTRRKKVFLEMDMRQLRILSADLRRIQEQREEELKKIEAQEQLKLDKIQAHLASLRSDGIEPDELLSGIRSKKRPSIGPVKTYQIDGELITYKGVGKYPKRLRMIIDNEGELALSRYEVND
ncbi:hypothetical protein C3D80_19630 [Cronobacter sakazakii]|uniref:H-NS family histone-like protein n=1 Tax=Cronobacter sakazakii TaxID=28141 RepID=UPI0009BAA29E|nr:H-NS family nucleoid-associated regulatory protein [Cronobacter sakazakii]MDK1224573.1 H-NS histone family protein [Cronobacter turicensis]EJJ0671517.1 H-NS histone family protein [Cronobacter sakazakii]EMC4401931.1 H-NS histone family protein [Cronobacter sakazakii]KAB0805746.1 H-NS histone family protein [Cronobacter sakazakii]KAB0887814.1 H-NS histone family protein [Cronobacter sakazakii]